MQSKSDETDYKYALINWTGICIHIFRNYKKVAILIQARLHDQALEQ